MLKLSDQLIFLKLFGSALTESHSKKLKGIEKLKELRIKQSSNICRLFYLYYKNKILIITSGYIKKSNKTNIREINKAIKLMNNILEEEK